MSLAITGKTAIVTGAASGLGLAIARHFLAKGVNVMVADGEEALLRAAFAEEARREGAVRVFAGDLTKKLSVTNLVAATVDAFERIDILVNANRRFATSDPLNIEADQVEALWEQNVLSALRLSQMVAKRMIHTAEKAGLEPGTPIGAIINLSSLAAHRTQPQVLGFSMACAAVEQMTRSLAVALAPKGIRVNAVSFGSIMSASLQARLKEEPGLREKIEAGTPMGRIAPPDEIAETVQYLASDAARFVTGQVLGLDGGRALLDAVTAPAF